jgi:mannose-6-phosphate isomerase-like protein (cupin superfamily)
MLGGQLLTYKVTAEQTGGAYSLFEGTVPPGGAAPPHIHHREDESFYVVEGEFEFTRDGESIRAAAGSLVYVPRGSLHAFENVGESTGTLLLSASSRRSARRPPTGPNPRSPRGRRT